jgi:hypothetical protein
MDCPEAGIPVALHAMNADHDPASGSHAAASGFEVLSDVLRCVRLTGSMLFLVDARSPCGAS